jgi:O-antigen ligase
VTSAVTDPTTRRSGRSPAPGELLVLVAAGGLLVLASPSVGAPFWSPRAALLLLVAGPGLVALALAARERDPAAIAGVIFLAVAAAAALLASEPVLAVLGPYNDGTGWLFLAGSVGLWALGRRLGDETRRTLGTVLIGAALVNALVVWGQSTTSLHAPLMELVEGRGPGLLGNPVHVSALLVGAAAVLVERLVRVDPRDRTTMFGGVAAMVLLASGVQLAGGRTGVALFALVLVRAFGRGGLRRGLPILLAAVIGLTAAVVAPSAENGATRRLLRSDGGWSGRVERWELAGPAIRARPVLGSGPAQYRRATSPHTTVAAARAFGPDRLTGAAHNLVVEYAVTTGLLGLAALLAWLALAARRARGELAWFALLGGASLLLQPQHLGLTAVLALALGAAAPRLAPPPPLAALVAAGALLVAGAVAGAGLLWGDLAMSRAYADLRPEDARVASDTLAAWPEPAVALARAETYQALSRHDDRFWPRAIAAARVAHERDPSDPAVAVVLGNLEAGHGSAARAAAAYEVALRWNPQSALALKGLADVRRAQGDEAAAAELCRRFHRVSAKGRCPV